MAKRERNVATQMDFIGQPLEKGDYAAGLSSDFGSTLTIWQVIYTTNKMVKMHNTDRKTNRTDHLHYSTAFIKLKPEQVTYIKLKLSK